mmetsp:Transcript_72242/g.233448  ORF Transcript_72242/g.233448 Transcript_72242/m.233448 type:complete len:335 (-) Transcript_72242:787-1791(-)
MWQAFRGASDGSLRHSQECRATRPTDNWLRTCAGRCRRGGGRGRGGGEGRARGRGGARGRRGRGRGRGRGSLRVQRWQVEQRVVRSEADILLPQLEQCRRARHLDDCQARARRRLLRAPGQRLPRAHQGCAGFDDASPHAGAHSGAHSGAHAGTRPAAAAAGASACATAVDAVAGSGGCRRGGGRTAVTGGHHRARAHGVLAAPFSASGGAGHRPPAALDQMLLGVLLACGPRGGGRVRHAGARGRRLARVPGEAGGGRFGVLPAGRGRERFLALLLNIVRVAETRGLQLLVHRRPRPHEVLLRSAAVGPLLHLRPGRAGPLRVVLAALGEVGH